MLQHLKEEYCKALRSEEYQQCFKKPSEPGNKVCAVQLLAMIKTRCYPNAVHWTSLKMSDNEVYRLIQLNDNERKSFKEIADIVEIDSFFDEKEETDDLVLKVYWTPTAN